MSQTSDIFDGLIANLKVDNSDTIAARRDEITKALNKEFRGLESSTSNRLMVGSYGRWTAIKGISDLDLLYILPASMRAEYDKEGGPSKMLARTRLAIQGRYPKTSVTVDRLVVVVQFTNFMFEVQPVFENDDRSFSYPDTYSDSWKTTKPREEIEAISTDDLLSDGNLRRLCKLARAWKNRHGIGMGGLLIDTLVHNFMRQYPDNRSVKFDAYDELVRDFFYYLSEEEDHEFYAAPGSRQHVRVKKKFQRKAKNAYELCIEAINAVGQKNAYKKWRSVFGNSVPAVSAVRESLTASAFNNTEGFIEDRFPVDVRYSVSVDCTVTQNGFRPFSLRSLASSAKVLPPRKKLVFTIVESDVPEPFDVRWKVLNRGPLAEKRNEIRGQIINPNRGRDRHEITSFRGHHHVECYILKNGIVVARDGITVPISAE
jgi:hypothetical protein